MENIFIETDRMLFRRMSKQDFSDVAEMLKNPNVMYAWEYVFEDIDVLAWIKKCREYYKKYGLGYFLAQDKQSGDIVGQIALMPDVIDGVEYYEIGYILKEKHWHKGYARTGAKIMADYAFNKLNLNSVIFEIRPENVSSRKVAESLGAVLTGKFIKNVQGKNMEHLIYTLRK
ncbi:MAG: GNAT family N-acetyltransferase [Candidatus Gastranaerophilaceae bacterium]